MPGIGERCSGRAIYEGPCDVSPEKFTGLWQWPQNIGRAVCKVAGVRTGPTNGNNGERF